MSGYNDSYINIRASREDREKFRQEARRRGMDMSTWIRFTLLGEIERERMNESFSKIGRRPT